MMPDTEPANEPRKTGHHLTDIVVGFSAIFISVCSLVIAIRHGQTMERLVEANSRPFVQFNSGNGTIGPKGEMLRELSISISNPGSGSARIETFEITLDGQVLPDWAAALKQLKQEAFAKHVIPSAELPILVSFANVAPSYLKGGGEQTIVRWIPTDASSALWEYADAARQAGRFSFKTCYCSIFDECWVASSAKFRPEPVTSCS